MESPTLNVEINVSWRYMLHLCLTLIRHSVGVDLGLEYPNYHVWTYVAFWACLITSRKTSTPLTVAPQYNFYKAERPEPTITGNRDVSIQTRSAKSTNLRHLPVTVALAEMEKEHGLFPSEVISEEDADEESFEDTGNTTIASETSEKITWRTPDGTVFKHLHIPSLDSESTILPVILIENKPVVSYGDIKALFEAINDPNLPETRRMELQDIATDLVDSHLEQLKQQADFVFAEYPGVGAIYGIVAVGWWWRGWCLRKDVKEKVVAEDQMDYAVPIHSSNLEGFHLELARIWYSAFNMPKPEDVSKDVAYRSDVGYMDMEDRDKMKGSSGSVQQAENILGGLGL
ncbi:hypothetical protein D9758_010803 [Tetrapyrgos nigripes]|uniref:Uncharacterized protein n=1 Tax=Tetrapyrgos nigripes TaxID=182062 RepID=A0A8H5LQ32_9AGAR|nr:hypothetical protein D9758_010803 [Tetrapyrgos nigripes]